MKTRILTISFIILMCAFGGLSFASQSSMSEETYKRFISGEVPVESVKITYNHWLHPGWNEKVEINGGIIRVYKSVHNVQLFNDMREQIAARGYAAPYEEELMETEEGDFDVYYRTDIAPSGLIPFKSALQNHDFYNMEDIKGCHEVWTIEIEISGAKKIVSTVVLKDLPGFSEIIGTLMPLINDAKQHEVSE
ncbi:MAG: hypothetical protein ABIG42_05940, partial [bacterium]